MAYDVYEESYFTDDAPDEDTIHVVRIRTGLEKMEQEGWTLVQVVAQHHVHDAKGKSKGLEGPYYIFHR